MVVRHSPIPLYAQLEDELRARMAAGDLAASTRIPSEADLARQHSVSRITAQKAVDRLVAEGLLFRQPGKGTFVAQRKLIHEPSQALSFSRAMAERGLRCDTRVVCAELASAPGDVAAILGVNRGAKVVFIRRVRLVEGTPRAAHASYLPVRFAGLLDADLSGSLIEAMQAVGASIAMARDVVEAREATSSEAALLGLTVGSALFAVRGTAFGYDGTAVRHSETLYPGGAWQFSVESRNSGQFQPTPVWVRKNQRTR